MSRQRSPSSELETALNNFRRAPGYVEHREALENALENRSDATRLATYKELREEFGVMGNIEWLNDKIAYELSCNGKHDEALAYWKGRFLKYPAKVTIHRGLEFALERLSPAIRLEKIKNLEKDLKKNVKGDDGADWIRQQYIGIQAAMKDYTASLKVRYENWKSDPTSQNMESLAGVLKDAVKGQPELVMEYLTLLADHDCFEMEIFMRVKKTLHYKGGDSTSYLKKCITSTKTPRIEQCFAYIYLKYTHDQHKKKHTTEQKHDGGKHTTPRSRSPGQKHDEDKHKARRSHSLEQKHDRNKHKARRSHSPDHIQDAIRESDDLDNTQAMEVVKKLREYKFQEQAEELCLRRMKKEPWGVFKDEFLRMRRAYNDLEAARILYYALPDIPRYAINFVSKAGDYCVGSSHAAGLYEQVLVRSKSDTDAYRYATNYLVKCHGDVDTKDAVDTWKRLISAYPNNITYRNDLKKMLNTTGTLDQAIMVWGKLSKTLKDTDSEKMYQAALKEKESLAKQKK